MVGICDVCGGYLECLGLGVWSFYWFLSFGWLCVVCVGCVLVCILSCW